MTIIDKAQADPIPAAEASAVITTNVVLIEPTDSLARDAKLPNNESKVRTIHAPHHHPISVRVR